VSASRHTSKDERIAEEAAQWLIDLEENEADLAGFTSWLQASPLHVEEFLLVSAVWQAADRVDERRLVDIEQLVSQARANVKWLDQESKTLAHVFNVQQKMHAALRSRVSGVIALITVMIAAYWGFHDNSLQYGTDVGEQRIVKLADGSIVTLNTRSRIKVRLEREQRLVELTEGEALFEVAHDVHRPFRVLAGANTVQAVGTQFDVNRSATTTVVAVVQGVVEVTTLAGRNEASRNDAHRPERLIAGEQAQLSPQGELLQHSIAELDRVTAWRERRLIFRNEPLASIVAEFNRYNEAQMAVEGSATGARLVTGVFDADKPSALIAFLERDPQLSIEPRGKTIVIRGP
jgi:transmembrane sensor